MSGDVQPRKRKDKKKAKRDSLDRRSEGDIFTRKQSVKDDEEVKESHHGVHAEKMGKDDFHLHVQGDHETGGHWCAKLFFFSLMIILVGIVGLIILENRGSSDLDTPLSESRFSEYFEGWVDEHRQAHDDHHSPSGGLDEPDGAPFEEEEDHSEPVDEDHNAVDDHDEDEEDDHADDEVLDGEDNEDGNDEAEDESNPDDNEDDDDIEPEINRVETSTQNARNKREVDKDDNDEGFEDDDGGENDEDNDDNNDSNANDDADDEQNDDNNPDDEDDEDDAPFEESSTNKDKIAVNIVNEVKNEESVPEQLITVVENVETNVGKEKETLSKTPKKIKKDDDDFDDADESVEKVIDNDAGEELHLRRKAEQEELAARAAASVEEESESAPLAVKIAVGLALAFVARLVLVKKTQPSKPDEPIEGSTFVKRRFTMISAEDDIPVENEELLDDELDEEYSDEEEGDQEDDDPELQYSEDLEEEEIVDDNAHVQKYIPETFEQLNAMFRSKQSKPSKPTSIEQSAASQPVKTVETAPKPGSPYVTKEEHKKVVIEELPKVSLIPTTEQSKIQQREFASQLLQSEQLEYLDDEDQEVDEEVGDDDEMELDEREIYSGSEEDADEDVSDVDDDDLMQRLEAKYGKLPDRKYESEDEDVDGESWTKVRGPQSYLDDDSYIDEEIKRANEELFNDNLKSALHIYETLTFKFPEHPGALYGKAKVLDRLATKYRSNEFLHDAIKTYQMVMNLGDKVSDEIFRKAGDKCLERMRFRGMLAQAVPVHRRMIRRFSDDPAVRNQLAVTYLLQNRYEEAKYILHHTLMRWRDDGFAQVHYGFILKIHNNDLKGSVALLREGIASGANGTQDGRFYFTLGDALTRLGETKEALEIYQKGADLKLFPSLYQRSLYNVDGLKAQPIWTSQETTYEKDFSILRLNWEIIRKEGLAALSVDGLYMDEAESLRDKGDWKQLELFARGYRIEKNCAKTPLTCNMIETFPAARLCKRGQVKFSIMHPGTHVWPHCGPTNCRLRAHLGLVVPGGTMLRVAKEERTWKAGEWLIFDDSFEHEVWHNGTSPRLVLIVDVWHPELTEAQRDSLSRI